MAGGRRGVGRRGGRGLKMRSKAIVLGLLCLLAAGTARAGRVNVQVGVPTGAIVPLAGAAELQMYGADGVWFDVLGLPYRLFLEFPAEPAEAAEPDEVTPKPEAEAEPAAGPDEVTPKPEAEAEPAPEPDEVTPKPEAEAEPAPEPDEVTPKPEAEAEPVPEPDEVTPKPEPEAEQPAEPEEKPDSEAAPAGEAEVREDEGSEPGAGTDASPRSAADDPESSGDSDSEDEPEKKSEPEKKVIGEEITEGEQPRPEVPERERVEQEDEGLLGGRPIAAGVQAYYSNHYTNILIGAEYWPYDELRISLGVPLLMVSADPEDGSEQRAFGLGDVSVGVAYRFSFSDWERFRAMIGAAVTIPSGDAERVEGGVWLPTGNGTYALLAYLVGGYRFDSFSMHAMFAYRGSGEVKVEQPGGGDLRQSAGSSFHFALGGGSDQLLEDFVIGLRFTGFVALEGETTVEYPTADGGSSSFRTDSNDALFALDGWLYARYGLSEQIDVVASIGAPLYDKFDADVKKVHYRDFFWHLGLEYAF